MDGTGGGPAATEPTMDEPTGWSTRRKVFVAVAALLLAGGAFVAGAGGGLGSITDRLGGGSTLTADWASGEVVAADTDAGVVASVEVAPAGDGGRCVRVRLGSDVSTERCESDALNPWDDPGFEIVRLGDRFGSFGEVATRNGDGWTVAVHGAVHPDVSRVTAHFGDGKQYSFVTRDPGGWFVAIVPADVADPDLADGHLVNPVVLLELFDDDGTRVASVDLP